MFGGYNSDDVSLNTTEMYGVLHNTWTTCSPMSEIRDGVAATSVGSKVYAMGGYKGNNILTTVECYDVHSKVSFTNDVIILGGGGGQPKVTDGKL